jgi:hypothetical protein
VDKTRRGIIGEDKLQRVSRFAAGDTGRVNKLVTVQGLVASQARLASLSLLCGLCPSCRSHRRRSGGEPCWLHVEDDEVSSKMVDNVVNFAKCKNKIV